jgi:hypothetical protein
MAFQYQKNLGKKVHHFRQARRFAMNSSQAAGPLWEFRWGNGTGDFALINRVWLRGIQIASATPEELRFNLKVARSFTATDDTNTASIKVTDDNQKLSERKDDTRLTAFRESDAATAATGGTKTLDTHSIAQGSFVSLTTPPADTIVGAVDIFDFNPISHGEELLKLEQDTGWVISLEATKGATAGVVLLLETSWSEVERFQNVYSAFV